MQQPADRTSSDRLQGLGEFVRARRRELGLTQTQLADRLGWSQERVSVLEGGRYGMPSLQGLALLADGLEVGLAEIIQATGFSLDRAGALRNGGHGRAGADALLITLDQLMSLQATSLREVMTEAATILAELMATDKIDAFILEPDTQTLVAIGASSTPMGFRQRQLGLDRVPLAMGSREAQVFLSGQPYLTPDAAQDPTILPGMVQSLGVQSMMLAPFDVNGERRGLLTANSSRPGSFTESDLAFLSLVARWVGMVAQQAETTESVARGAAQSARRGIAEELMQVLAHDLTNLVTPLHGRLDLIRREVGGPETAAHVEEAMTSVGRIEHLVADLLDATRLEHGLFSLATQPVDLIGLAREVAAHFHSGETPVEVRGVESIVVEADAERLRQVLENLVSNGRRHSPSGAPVVIEITTEASEGGEWAVLAVSDAGPGISPETLGTIFQRFSPGPGSPGLGLGLYLARGIAEAHGGRLTVDSPGVTGTTMRVALPLEPTEQSDGN